MNTSFGSISSTRPKRMPWHRDVSSNRRSILVLRCRRSSKLARRPKSSHGRNCPSRSQCLRTWQTQWARVKNSRLEIQKLQQFEDEARQEKIGGWGINVGRLNTRAPRQIAFSVFVSEQKPQPPATRPAHSTVPASPKPTPSTPIAANNPAGSRKSHAKEKTSLGRIEVNTATEKELTTVPGIGHVMAARIIAARPFRSADDLKKVSGIGDKKYAQIRPYFQ